MANANPAYDVAYTTNNNTRAQQIAALAAHVSGPLNVSPEHWVHKVLAQSYPTPPGTSSRTANQHVFEFLCADVFIFTPALAAADMGWSIGPPKWARIFQQLHEAGCDTVTPVKDFTELRKRISDVAHLLPDQERLLDVSDCLMVPAQSVANNYLDLITADRL